jgi:hypothetical protein
MKRSHPVAKPTRNVPTVFAQLLSSHHVMNVAMFVPFNIPSSSKFSSQPNPAGYCLIYADSFRDHHLKLRPASFATMAAPPFAVLRLDPRLCQNEMVAQHQVCVEISKMAG